MSVFLMRGSGYLALFVLLLVVPATHSQTVYKWVDDHGNLQFSDRPPLEQDAEELELRSDSPTVQGKPEPPAAGLGMSLAEYDARTLLPGIWRNVHPDQTIVMTLGTTGSSRWQVAFEGRNWSDLSGAWSASDGQLTLSNQLGGTDYSVTVVSRREIHLNNSDYAEPMIFTR